MTALDITAWHALAGASITALPPTEGPSNPGTAPAVPAEVAALYDDALPSHGWAIRNVDVRAELGRKGTSTYDRNTALAIMCAQRVIDQAAVSDPESTAVVVGTTVGSLKSTSDYSKATLVEERPYHVNPILFPNSVMNCSAGQAGIRFGLRGPNATIAAGPMALHTTLRYATNLVRQGYANEVLTITAEEYTPHRAWQANKTSTSPAGEGAVAFRLRAQSHENNPRFLATRTGFAPGARQLPALERCIGRVLEEAGVDPSDVATAAAGAAAPGAPDVEALARALPGARILHTVEHFGDCGAATAALAAARVLTRTADQHTSSPYAVIVASDPDGSVGATLLHAGGDLP